MLLIMQDQPIQITQATVIAILIVSTLLMISLLVLIGYIARKTERALEYGNFFVVTLGIVAALMGFLVSFPLLVGRVFSDPTQVLALLSALLGTIVGLVGTYFGVKSSNDARQAAQQLASDTIASDTTPPTVSSVKPDPGAQGVSRDTHVTATFSKDMDRATINTTTFKLVEVGTLTPVAGDTKYDSPTQAATFVPKKDALVNGNTYRATITTDVKDQVGNALAQDHTWEFGVTP